MTLNPALMSSARGDWQTPEIVLEALRQAFGDITLDPCTTYANPCRAKRILTPAEDGLKSPWLQCGLIYVNPPYGRGIGPWIQKCHQYRKAGRVDPIVALVPARTDTAWWQDNPADAVCFWRGRLTFRGAPHPAPFPSALLFWGADESRFITVFNACGEVWRDRL